MNNKTVLAKWIRHLSAKMAKLSKKIQYSKYQPRIFQHMDCFDTIETLLTFIQPKYLCDIGANVGNWTYVLEQVNPQLEHVVLFEPQAKYQEQLRELSLLGVTKVIYQCGLGEKRGHFPIKGGTGAASFLDSDDANSFYYPNTLTDRQEEVEICVLDDVYTKDNLPIPDVIKLDVQGYELNVLKGGTGVLRQSKYLAIELSFRSFYKCQPCLWEIFKFLHENGFVMVGRGHESWESKFWSPKYPKELLQMDAIFMNTESV